jgi:head-tail adaptor
VRPSFARQTVTVLRAAETTDRYGNPMSDWSSPNTHDISGCVLQPLAGEETLSLDADSVLSRWSLDTPADADLTATDRVSYAGEVYEVDGQIGDWPSPTGRLRHRQAMLKRLERT